MENKLGRNLYANLINVLMDGQPHIFRVHIEEGEEDWERRISPQSERTHLRPLMDLLDRYGLDWDFDADELGACLFGAVIMDDGGQP